MFKYSFLEIGLNVFLGVFVILDLIVIQTWLFRFFYDFFIKFLHINVPLIFVFATVSIYLFCLIIVIVVICRFNFHAL